MQTTYVNPRANLVWASRSALAALAVIVAASSALAQTVTLRSQPLRFTIPKGVASSNFCTLTIPVSGLVNQGVDTINLAVTGVPGSGAAATFLSTNGLTSNLTYTATLILTNDATIAAGEYDMAVEATGAASFRLPVPVQVAYIWSGSDFTNGVSTNWASAGNWLGGVVPGPTDLVVFKDIGGVANNTTTNIVVANDVTVASVRFSPEVSATRFNTVEILDGRKLSVTGAGLSFSMHRDSKTTSAQMETKIVGGGTLEVASPTAQIGLLVDQQQNTTLDMRELNNFVADVSRIGLGNHRIWPNLYTNGYTGEGTTAASSMPFRFVPLVWLAKTNVIKCSWVDPNNYTDPGIRDYAIEVGNDTAAGTTANIRLSLGLSNAFFIDSICWGHAGKGGGGNNFNFNATNSYALFRGIGGGRISVWAQGDASGQAASGSNVRGTTVDFGNGQVDASIDRLYLGRGRTNSTGVTIQGTLTIGGAYLGTIVDVNTAILGYQDVSNLGVPTQGISGPVGTINVNSNATLRVNGDLQLGYTTASAVGTPNYPENCAGTLSINNSGTVMASNVLAGGATKLSVNNNISVNNGGKLIVTNILGASDARINNFTLANNAQLTLLGVTVGQTSAYVRTFSAATACNINVPSISGYTTGDVTISVISYVTASPVITGLSVTPPPGLFIKSIVDNTGSQTIDVTFTDRPPLVLVWRGNVNNNWSTNVADKNWVTQVGGLQTNFVDGDSVIFDDTATGSTSIDIGTVAPGQTAATYGIVVNSTAKSYTFNSGNVIGSATLQKLGSSTLTVNAAMATGVLLVQGSLTGGGSVGPTALQDGVTMTSFTGSVSGGLSASNAAVTVLGSVTGGLNLRAGSLANSGTINGSVTLATNVTLNNTVGAAMNVNVPWTVPTNSTLINNGTIRHSGAPGGNNGLTVNGSLRGVGVISSQGTNAIADVRVTMGAGSAWTIGNSSGEVTNTTVAVRLDFLGGSTTTFDVDNSAVLNDKILLSEGFNVGKVNFGAGNGLGGTFVINKIAGPAFNIATVLNLFDLISNNPDNQSQAIPGVIPAPAPGLVWNVSRVVTNLTIGVMGPPFMTNSIANGTNLVFEWSEANRGWRLERQTNSLLVGLDWISTNWVSVANSFGGTNVYYPDTNNLSEFYFRSVQTISPTNAPTVFYRLTYP